MPTDPFIKICGVREASVMAAAVRAGASAIGLNFVPGSRRAISRDRARLLLERLRAGVESPPVVVGVFADAEAERIDELRVALSLDLVQLHGHESPETVAELQPALKAIRIGSEHDFVALETYPGDLLLVDARVAGKLGGTGQRIPIDLARQAARRRPIVLAGGLDASNVASTIQQVRPAGVDTASGAEDASGAPSAEAAERFVRAAKEGFASLAR